MDKARGKGRGTDKLSINLSCCKYDIIREAAVKLGYEVAEEGESGWDLFWTDLSVTSDRVQKMKSFQRLNHFPGMLEICRKGALSRNLGKLAKQLPALYNFYPQSLVLPEQLDEFMGILKRNKARMDSGNPPATWILKPSAGTMGKGIYLVQSPQQLQELDVSNVVAQSYITNPLLLDGFKFDLRVYALVMSADPLRIMLYDEGLARFATETYSAPDQSNLRTAMMHLTNYAVNKASEKFIHSDDAAQGSKRLMSSTLQQLAEQHSTTKDFLMRQIASVVNKTIMSIQPLLAHTYHTALPASATNSAPTCFCLNVEHATPDGMPCDCPPSQCFELLGFDIMFDQALQPWLLEVNHSPSFSTETQIDKQVKLALLMQTIHQLGQDVADRVQYFDAQARALNERLYSGVGSSSSGSGSSAAAALRRPGSGLGRGNKGLQAAAAALDEALYAASAVSGSGQGGNGRARSGGGIGGGGSHSKTWRDHGGDIHDNYNYAVSSKLNTAAIPKGMGQYVTIYPANDERDRQMYVKVLQTAADIYPDQRCQCAWCFRRRELRLLQMSFRDLGIAASRPASAIMPLAGGGSGAGANHSSGGISANHNSGNGTSGPASYSLSGGPNSSPQVPASSSLARGPPASRSLTRMRSGGSHSRRNSATSIGTVGSTDHSDTLSDVAAGEEASLTALLPSRSLKPSSSFKGSALSSRAQQHPNGSSSGGTPPLPPPLPPPPSAGLSLHSSPSAVGRQMPPGMPTPPSARTPQRFGSQHARSDTNTLLDVYSSNPQAVQPQDKPDRDRRSGGGVAGGGGRRKADGSSAPASSPSASAMLRRSQSCSNIAGDAPPKGPSSYLEQTAWPLPRSGAHGSRASAAVGVHDSTHNSGSGATGHATSTPGKRAGLLSAPRIPPLSSAPNPSNSQAGGGSKSKCGLADGMDSELLSMRARTTSLLSNRFISVYMTKR